MKIQKQGEVLTAWLRKGQKGWQSIKTGNASGIHQKGQMKRMKYLLPILDSSIWIENAATKVVWITLLATMDDDGFAHFATIKNLSNRAGLSLEATEDAVKVLASRDLTSMCEDHDGYRIKRVYGGWMVFVPRF